MRNEAPAAAEKNARLLGAVAGFLRPLVAEDAATVRRVAAAVAILSLLRFVLGATLPLSYDEAYYWLWSKHLAAGYFDHPPAIAYAIRGGTILFGDTPFGVRLFPLAGSLIASFAVWRAARILLGDALAAARACLYFNITLMVAVETMAATPDAMALASSALLFWALAKLIASDDWRWWLAAGAAGGFCLLSKYTAFFLGAGVLCWLLATASGRRWVVTPWPYLGGVIASFMFAPVVAWNAQHGWISFKFQFGRIADGGWEVRYIIEFVLAQAALASPFLLVLGSAGFVRASRWSADRSAVTLAAVATWPAVAYFAVHALHDRVQGNWPSFLYPAFAVLASYGCSLRPTGRILRRGLALSRLLAVPVASLMLAGAYAQAFFDIVPVRDPIARLTAIGFEPVASGIEAAAHRAGASAIVTTSYATTAWLRFYLKPAMPVVQLNEGFRWLAAPEAPRELGRRPLLFANLHRTGRLRESVLQFSSIRYVTSIDRRRGRALIERYDIYAVSGWTGGALGREP